MIEKSKDSFGVEIYPPPEGYRFVSIVAGWAIVSASAVGAGASAWIITDRFQSEVDFWEPTPAKIALTSILAVSTLVGTILSVKAEQSSL